MLTIFNGIKSHLYSGNATAVIPNLSSAEEATAGSDPNKIRMDWVQVEDSRDSVDFKAYLAAGTKKEDLMVDIQGVEFLIITELKKDGGSLKFSLPVGVIPNGFVTSMDAATGVLTVTFKTIIMPRPFDLDDVTMYWEEKDQPAAGKDNNKGDVVSFKAQFPVGTKIEDLMVGIESGKFLVLGKLQKKKKEEADACYDGRNCRRFELPDGVNPNGFKASMDGGGVFTVTFTKLKPEKKILSSSKKFMGGLAKAVPACLLMISYNISDLMTGAN